MKWLIGATALVAAPAAAQTTPLFASDVPIRITIRGPIAAIARSAEDSTEPRDAQLTLAGAAEVYPIKLSPRGITRRKKDVCSFPPLRVDFVPKPPATSLFAHQGKLKLVTHCQSQERFQEHLLLEYAAYRIFNLISPASFRVRLATVDYAEPNGRVSTTRWGFFIEDLDDAARRNNMARAQVGDRIPSTQLDAKQGARMALFEYMIGNLDWSMRASHAGETCCHNFKLMAKTANAQSGLIPVPYDYDYSGFVNTPYAVPPEELRVSSVRDRMYRGYCIHNAQALAAAAQFRAKRGEMLGVLASIPGIDEGKRRGAAAYLDKFFSEIATDADVTKRVLRTCIN